MLKTEGYTGLRTVYYEVYSVLTYHNSELLYFVDFFPAVFRSTMP